MNEPKIVLLGGGTGSFTLLQALKKLTPNITAVVNMSDNGGSTGILRDELGVLPPGDARQCLVALSESPDVRNLFSYRFANGTLGGHTVGNLILSALEKQHGGFQQAVEVASRIMRITGTVLPVTLGNHHVVLDDGGIHVHGENSIGSSRIQHREAMVHLEPTAQINPKARRAIYDADLVVIAPGDVYGSLLPLFAVTGVPAAIMATPAKVVSITNLVTKPGQTDGWHVVDYVHEAERYLGIGAIDFVLYNNAVISDELLRKYALDGEFAVITESTRFSEVRASPIGAQLVSQQVYVQDAADMAIRRTLIRHDAEKVCRALQKILH